MIEIIICHNDIDSINALQNNIGQTCGAEYIFSPVDNRNGKFDIFTAYDSKIKESNADIIVCCHQDIVFHTKDWGAILENH